MKVTNEMIGRAGAVFPVLSNGAVMAILEAALAGAVPTIEERMSIEQSVIAERFPGIIIDFLMYMRLHSFAFVYHDGVLENTPSGRTAEEAAATAAAGMVAQLGDNGVTELAKELQRALWDASHGLQAIKKL